MKILGLITARGGSKGIPRKNIKELLGKPLLRYTVESALEAKSFDRLILSTDDQEIADIAKGLGVEVPFLRPTEFASDTSSHLDVVKHALAWLKEHEAYEPDAVMILQPTSPTRQPFHIKEACDLLIADPLADSVLSVAKTPDAFSSMKIMHLQDTYLRLLDGSPIYRRVARRQDLPTEYFSAGLLYLFKSSLVFGDQPNFYGENTLPYEVEERYLVDIDTPEDWAIAEEKLRQLMGTT